MKQFKYTVRDELGLHARPAGMLAKEAKKYQSVISITTGERTSPVTSLIKIMSMGIKKGNEITVTIVGDDEVTAYGAIIEFINENL